VRNRQVLNTCESALFPWHGKQTRGKNVCQIYQLWEHCFRLLYIHCYNCKTAYVNKPLDSLPHLLKCMTSHWPHICWSSIDFKATCQASWCNYELGHACQGCVPKGHKLIVDHSCNVHPFQFIIFCHPLLNNNNLSYKKHSQIYHKWYVISQIRWCIQNILDWRCKNHKPHD
jgi:hypothetical protein